MMNLIVKVDEAGAVPGGRAILLCDHKGQPLPQQMSHILEQEVGECSILTVRFRIDGKQIALV